MAVSVYPERMDQIDPEDVEASLRTLETYIHYICERTEFALTNTFRTTSGLGSSAEAISLVLQEAVDSLHALESTVGALTSTVNGKVDKVAGMGLSANDYTDEDKEDVDTIDGLNDRVASLEEVLTHAGPIITMDPTDVAVPVNTTAVFTVRAIGTGLAYQWQWRAAGSTTWATTTVAGNQTDTINMPATTARSGNQYRCTVTDTNGKMSASRGATLTVI